MPGRVFISCGQRGDEKDTAQQVRTLLENKFKLTTFIAATIQTFGDIMIIADELRKSDYYLFIDFVRRNDTFPVSLFTHQELALAHHLGFRDNAIFLRQKDAPLEGFLKYILGNAEEFSDRLDLLEKVKRLAQERGWNPSYSRNLVIVALSQTGRLHYRDQTSLLLVSGSVQDVWQVQVRNRRPDTAALGTICVLSHIQEQGRERLASVDRSPLKWAQQASYAATLLPGDFGFIDVFALQEDNPGIFLHSLWDAPRDPVILKAGEWTLFYKLFAQNFPLVDFSIALKVGEPVEKGFQQAEAQLVNAQAPVRSGVGPGASLPAER